MLNISLLQQLKSEELEFVIQKKLDYVIKNFEKMERKTIKKEVENRLILISKIIKIEKNDE